MAEGYGISPLRSESVYVSKTLSEQANTNTRSSSVSQSPEQLVGGQTAQVTDDVQTKSDVAAKNLQVVDGGSQKVDANLERINQQLEKLQNYLRFEKDESSQKMVIIIKNNETDEVIRQIPSEAFLNISKNISDYLALQKQNSETSQFPTGLLTDEQA
ncbi:flagellar protein FlaG [Thiomicrorhabdus xiamenensis]|uniref:Flagellar protein FlaG n=1 Tax=Thiomicrorhabdus xiamenensis TaxID=2739063 RepID=A0A7D4SJ65_9GAMM|nr:flagellar protein FlaG [Thiomicrorhabdus xiamenensis]QKI89559.1 flagellar protein FlaG [Thiomicrorhabdus xiamenensis]